MKKSQVTCLLLAGFAGLSLATAQTTKTHSSPSKNDPASVNKPLTPKSSAPAKRKSAAPVPPVSNSTRSNNAQLNHLERGSGLAPAKNNSGAKAASAKPAPAKPAPAKADAGTSPSGSGINATYQAPKVPKR